MSNPGGTPIEVFDGYRAALAANRAQLYLDIPTGPFYGFNRPGAKVSQGLIDNWWRQGMMGSAKAGYECIKAFSETDFTEDLKAIEVPVLVIHSEDDQIVPYADSAPLAVKLLKNGTLKTYKDLPHGLRFNASRAHQRRPAGVHRRSGSRRESGDSADRTGLAKTAARARQMVGVGDRHGERVGGVGAGDLHAGEEALDHRVDLRFLGIAGADDGFLDQPRGIFADRDSRRARRA